MHDADIRQVFKEQMWEAGQALMNEIENTSNADFVLKRQAFELMLLPKTLDEFMLAVVRAWLIRAWATRLGNTMRAAAIQVAKVSYENVKDVLKESRSKKGPSTEILGLTIPHGKFFDVVTITTKRNTHNSADKAAALRRTVTQAANAGSLQPRRVLLLIGEMGVYQCKEFDLVLCGPDAWGYLANDRLNGKAIWDTALEEAQASSMNLAKNTHWLVHEDLPGRCEKVRHEHPEWMKLNGQIDPFAVVESLVVLAEQEKAAKARKRQEEKAAKDTGEDLMYMLNHDESEDRGAEKVTDAE